MFRLSLSSRLHLRELQPAYDINLVKLSNQRPSADTGEGRRGEGYLLYIGIINDWRRKFCQEYE